MEEVERICGGNEINIVLIRNGSVMDQEGILYKTVMDDVCDFQASSYRVSYYPIEPINTYFLTSF